MNSNINKLQLTNTNAATVNVNPMADLKDSLRDIASLLMLIHEQYFKNSIGIQNNLLGLIKFVTDTGMNQYVTIIDIENARIKCTPTNSPVFDTKQFYEWLKIIANTVFYNTFHDEKKNLYFVLVKYLLPFAANQSPLSPTGTAMTMNSPQQQGNNNNNQFQLENEFHQNKELYQDLIMSANIDSIMKYSNFLKLLFINLLNGGQLNNVSLYYLTSLYYYYSIHSLYVSFTYIY